MIIQNDQDRRAVAWLIEKFGAEAVAEAETRIAGERRPYGILPTSIARKLLLRYQQKETVRITDNKKPPFRRVLACNFCGGYPPIIFLSPPIRRGGAFG